MTSRTVSEKYIHLHTRTSLYKTTGSICMSFVSTVSHLASLSTRVAMRAL